MFEGVKIRGDYSLDTFILSSIKFVKSFIDV